MNTVLGATAADFAYLPWRPDSARVASGLIVNVRDPNLYYVLSWLEFAGPSVSTKRPLNSEPLGRAEGICQVLDLSVGPFNEHLAEVFCR